jgi:hypothetical protein
MKNTQKYLISNRLLMTIKEWMKGLFIGLIWPLKTHNILFLMELENIYRGAEQERL